MKKNGTAPGPQERAKPGPADPFREFAETCDRMGQPVNAAFPGVSLTRLTDVSETVDAYLIEAELPGASGDSLNVGMNDRELLITGEISSSVIIGITGTLAENQLLPPLTIH